MRRIRLLFKLPRDVRNNYTDYPKGSHTRVYGALYQEYGPENHVVDLQTVRAFLRNGNSHGLREGTDLDKVISELITEGFIAPAA
jgi:hypothetical protein